MTCTKTKLTEGTLKLSLLKDTEGSCLYVYSRPPITSPNSNTLILNTTAPSTHALLAGHKTHNYMEVMHLLSLARAQATMIACVSTPMAILAETATSNLFFLKDGTPLHPRARCRHPAWGYSCRIATRLVICKSKRVSLCRGQYATPSHLRNQCYQLGSK